MISTSVNHSAAEDDQPGGKPARAQCEGGKTVVLHHETGWSSLNLLFTAGDNVAARRLRSVRHGGDLTANPLCAEFACFLFCFDAFPPDAGLFMRWPHLQKLFSFFLCENRKRKKRWAEVTRSCGSLTTRAGRWFVPSFHVHGCDLALQLEEYSEGLFVISIKEIFFHLYFCVDAAAPHSWSRGAGGSYSVGWSYECSHSSC